MLTWNQWKTHQLNIVHFKYYKTSICPLRQCCWFEKIYRLLCKVLRILIMPKKSYCMIIDSTPHCVNRINDHTSCARWEHMYLADIKLLEMTAPDVYEEFMQVNLIVKRTKRRLNPVPADQAGPEDIKSYSVLMLNAVLRLRSHAQLRMRAHGGYKTSWVRTQLSTPPWAYAQRRANERARLTRWPSFIQIPKRPDGTLWLTKITNLKLFINNINFRL